MQVYRLASRKYAPDNSEGARLYGGRWNRIGTPVIYASSTRSLAAVEVIAHHAAIPADYQVVVIDVRDTLAIETVGLEELPPSWPDEATMKTTADRGTEWATSLRTAVLQVPSAVMPAEYNYILNPLHPDFASIRFEVPDTESIDARLRR